ncbi:MAG: zinc ribbon domain-containing protein [Candidatus Polarisedimenticolia bacterium]
MAFCSRCGAQADGSAAFCNRCGAPLDGRASGPSGVERRDPGAAARLWITAKPIVDMGALSRVDVNSIQVEIDGRSTEMAWGERQFDLPPGTHQVRIAIKNPIFGGGRAAAEARVQLNPGETQRLVYRGPLTIFQSGKIERIESSTPAASPTAAAPFAPAAPASRCAGCGAPLPAGGRFCAACGKPATRGAACPNCNSPLGGGRFCTVCGFRLQS